MEGLLARDQPIFGTIVAMYCNDHAPPHFHVRYGQQKELIAIETLSLLEGSLNPRTLGLIIEWAAQHQQERLENWELARQQAPPNEIEPLE